VEAGGVRIDVRFIVITRADELDEGNLYHATLFKSPDGVLYVDVCPSKELLEKGWRFRGFARRPCFTKGEVLIVDGHGREVAPPGRRPAKWGVRYEVFDTLEEAVRRAREVAKGE